MREKLLMLARACPIVSQKYQHLVCIAGITEKGDWRRVYPVPWKTFWGVHSGEYKKRMWIEYELEGDKPSDHRSESRKLKPETVKPLYEESFANIKKILDDKATSIEELNKHSTKEISLGVIKPEITDFVWSQSDHYLDMLTKQKQKTLSGESAVQVFIPKMSFRYKFSCKNEKECAGHKMLCEDWELSELYRHCEQYRESGKYNGEEEVLQKVKQKMFYEMKEKKDLYFIVGSHYLHPTYMIISFLAPRKTD